MNIKEFRNKVGGTIFAATFIKKDNTIRTIHGRLGVIPNNPKGLSSKQKQSDLINNYIRVCDFTKRNDKDQGYRILNLNTLIELNARGEKLKFN